MGVTPLQEVENAIRTLSPRDREKLIYDLPSLIPELDGDTLWNRILQNSTSRPPLTSLLNEADAEYRKRPESFPKLKESDFNAKK